jgi:mono/diheme cytochrome c family protein
LVFEAKHYFATSFMQRIAALFVLVLSLSAGGLMGMAPFDQGNSSAHIYVQSVFARQGNIDQGQAIFQMNCASCHGFTADGNVGPSLKAVAARKSRQAIIEQVTSGKTPPMPQFKPSSTEMADLLRYLESL